MRPLKPVGDAGALPYADGALDIVLSLNGFHAFPDKEAAYREVFRVLRPGGLYCVCGYKKKGYRRLKNRYIGELRLRDGMRLLTMLMRPNIVENY